MELPLLEYLPSPLRYPSASVQKNSSSMAAFEKLRQLWVKNTDILTSRFFILATHAGHFSHELDFYKQTAQMNLDKQILDAIRDLDNRAMAPMKNLPLKEWCARHPGLLSPSPQEVQDLAISTNHTVQQVRKYFQNKRAEARRKELNEPRPLR